MTFWNPTVFFRGITLGILFTVFYITAESETQFFSFTSFLIALIFAGLLVFALVRWYGLNQRLPTNDGKILAWIRIAAAGSLLGQLFIYNIPAVVDLPARLPIPQQYFLHEAIPGIVNFLAHPTVELGIYYGAIITAVLALLGYRTRLFAAAAAIFGLLAFYIPLQYVGPWHPGVLSIQLLLLMAWLPVGDHYALDATRTTKKTPAEYGFSLYLVWLVCIGTYLSVGISKLRDVGLDWITSDFLRGVFLDWSYTLDALSFKDQLLNQVLITAPDYTFIVVGVAVLTLQVLLAPLALFYTWARVLFALAVPLFSMLIYAVMGILFIEFIIIPFIAFFGYWYLYQYREQPPVGIGRKNPMSQSQWLLLGIVLFALLFQWHGHLKALPLTTWDLFSSTQNDFPSEAVVYRRSLIYFSDGSQMYIQPREVYGLFYYPLVCLQQNKHCDAFFAHFAKQISADYGTPVQQIDFIEAAYQYDPINKTYQESWRVTRDSFYQEI